MTQQVLEAGTMMVETMRNAIGFKYRNTPVTVVTLTPLDEFTVESVSYGPLEQGRELDVPRWVAEVLIAQNKVRFKHAGVDLPDLQKALWRETGDSVLQELPADFLLAAKQRIASLARENLQAPNDVRLAAQTKMERVLRDLIANRLLKLMKIALREERLEETKKRMAEEERWLVDRLVNLLRNWQKYVVELGTYD
jgi:hypothetical protein